MTISIPYIDPNVEHVGVSKLRTLNAASLRRFDKAMVIRDNDTPLAVLLSYEQFLEMQNQLRSVLETIDLLTNHEEFEGVLNGIEDMKAGRTKPLVEIRSALKKR